MSDIAIIDTGISLNYFDNVTELKSNLNFVDIYNIHEDDVPSNVMTHGTICATIIKQYASTARLHSLNVFSNGMSNIESIIAAIKYCIKRNIRIINVSFGTNDIKDGTELEDVINMAVANGIIIVASSSKNGIVTYPAYYNNVISVGVKNELHLSKNKILLNKNSSSIINIYASGIQRLYKEGRLIHITGNEPSYATAVVTALVNNILDASKIKVDHQQIFEMLTNCEFCKN